MIFASAASAIAVAIGIASGPVLWPRADPIPHVFDVAGPRSDGRLVVAAGGKLFLLNQVTGAREPFAAGPGGYPGAGGDGPAAVRCDLTSCAVTTIIVDNGTSHGEGHIVVAMGAPGAAFGPAPAAVRTESSMSPVALRVGLTGLALLVLLALMLGLTVRRNRPAA